MDSRDPRCALLLAIVSDEESYLQALTVTAQVFFTPLLHVRGIGVLWCFVSVRSFKRVHFEFQNVHHSS